MTFYPGWLDFDVRAWLAHRVALLFGDVPLEHVLTTPELRRELCVDDPLLFGFVYLGRHLEMDGVISYARPHLEWYEAARDWMSPQAGIAEWRHAFIAPRSMGKSTVWFLVIPMWALAYDHQTFVAAFANTPAQAEQHLTSFQRELDTNALLRRDFPDLVQPAVRPRGSTIADRQGMLHVKSGGVFAAKGIDSASLGLKVENRRPTVLILDDLEPDEARYSAALKEKRLGTLLDAILPLNNRAFVALVGTVTMPDSITHDLVRWNTSEPAEWVAEEGFTVHHHLPFAADELGDEVSVWPEKWPTEWMQKRRHTREFAKNYLNDPLARDGDYWTLDDFRYGRLQAVTRRVLSIDPAATSKTTSDPTGLAVVGYDPSVRHCQVEHAEAVRLPPAKLREKVLVLLARFELGHVLIETNQGGEWLAEVLSPLPAKVVTIHQDERKEHRAAKVLDHYQSGRVVHTERFPSLEGEMVSFPKGAHDDMVDAVGSAVLLLLQDVKQAPARAVARSYA